MQPVLKDLEAHIKRKDILSLRLRPATREKECVCHDKRKDLLG